MFSISNLQRPSIFEHLGGCKLKEIRRDLYYRRCIQPDFAVRQYFHFIISAGLINKTPIQMGGFDKSSPYVNKTGQ